ncbi:aminopeptidase C [Anaerobaca lacustris]|uniref:Aminopeptidase n=1 Tax=Anaerobaca lacustris TaxID=3044600 RepID=A0AAW6TVZ2_9BACT|nr:C1 family peptidase [Sedimentisphaerales bacterium M17dextr]
MREVMARLMGVLLVWLVLSAGAAAQDGALAPSQIERIRSEFQMDAHTRAMRNALTGASVRDIAENREIVAAHNDQFSHKIKTKGISNQKSSGRCWMFAGFNTIKPVVLNRLDLDSFEFSHIYLQFWDKMEKANSFLEYMIEYRDRDLQDRDMVFLLKDPAPDGGYWENFVDLVTKYGVIPRETMAETASSENTGMMNRALARLLRKSAAELREIYQETGSVRKMRDAKPKMLAEVYRVLVLNLGEPPEEFSWRHKAKGKAAKGDEEKSEKEDDSAEDRASDKKDDGYQVEQDWSALRTFTPESFYDEFVGLDLHQYVNVANDPIRPKGGHYEIAMTRNLYDGRNASYVSVDIQILKDLVVKVLLSNQPVYFAADVSPDQNSKTGIMARNLYDYESVYALNMGLNKTERLLLRDSTINHGMAFIGVDLVEGKAVKWLVENSWGSDRGRGGLWTMYDDWFDDNVYNIIVHRDDLPDEVRKILAQPTEKLPVWDPMW